jgi:hypothetical protein
VVTGDFNHDGKLDFATVDSFSTPPTMVGIFLGNGDGTFRPATYYSAPNLLGGLVAGDFTGDGNEDIIANTTNSGLALLKGNGDGTFQPFLEESLPFSPSQLMVADFNHDGKLDLAATNASSGGYAVLLGNGDGTFQPPAFYNVPLSAWGAADFNGDGNTDLLAATFVETNGTPYLVVNLLLGRGDGSFQVQLTNINDQGVISAVKTGDVNGDGKADVLVDLAGPAGGADTIEVFLSNGDGSFQKASVFPLTFDGIPELSLADINGDGSPDLLVVDASTARVMLGNGDGTFGPAIQTALVAGLGSARRDQGVVAGDFNNDGHLDLAIANGLNGTGITIAMGTGDGTFQSAPKPGGPPPSTDWRDVVTGDFNGDGKQDIAGRAANGQWWVSLSNGTSFSAPQLWDTWSTGTTWLDVHTGDFNGDGKTDIVGRASNGQWWVALSTGSSFNDQLWDTWSSGVTWADVKVGDFNGDGKADIAGRYLQGGTWWVGLSTGSGFNTTQWAAWSTGGTWVDVNVGDFNGDGKADIVGRALENGQWYVGLSNGSTGFNTTLWDTWSTGATWVDVKVGDFNGDGKADIVGRALENGQWYVGLSNGATGFNTSLWETWSTAATWVDVRVGDFNGDGKADITGRYLEGGSWWTAISNGTSFSTTHWDSWSASANWVDVLAADFTGTSTASITGRYFNGGSWWTGVLPGQASTLPNGPPSRREKQ